MNPVPVASDAPCLQDLYAHGTTPPTMKQTRAMAGSTRDLPPRQMSSNGKHTAAAKMINDSMGVMSRLPSVHPLPRPKGGICPLGGPVVHPTSAERSSASG